MKNKYLYYFQAIECFMEILSNWGNIFNNFHIKFLKDKFRYQINPKMLIHLGIIIFNISYHIKELNIFILRDYKLQISN